MSSTARTGAPDASRDLGLPSGTRGAASGPGRRASGLEGTRRAYGEAREATASPRAIEYAALSRMTGALGEAAGADDFARLAAALHDNLRLWTTLAADLAGVGNGYPEALRGQLISLAAFVQRHSRLVLSGQAGVDPLIDINTAVMRGLRGAEAAA